jgi:hypothetical protein
MLRILIFLLICLLAGGLVYWALRPAPARPESQVPAAALPVPSPQKKRMETFAVRMPSGHSDANAPDAAPVVVRKSVDVTIPQVVVDFDLWLRGYVNAAPEARGAMLDAGRALLPARRSAMVGLIASDPEAALLVSPSPADRALLPADFQSQIEQVVAGEGFYGVKAICNHDEFSAHGSGCRIEPEAVVNDTIYKASIYGTRKDRLTEEKASLYGVALDGKIALAEDDFVILPAEDISSDPAHAGQFAVTYKGRTTSVADEAALPAHIQSLLAR